MVGSHTGKEGHDYDANEQARPDADEHPAARGCRSGGLLRLNKRSHDEFAVAARGEEEPAHGALLSAQTRIARLSMRYRFVVRVSIGEEAKVVNSGWGRSESQAITHESRHRQARHDLTNDAPVTSKGAGGVAAKASPPTPAESDRSGHCHAIDVKSQVD
jgi:hypothetical protein